MGVAAVGSLLLTLVLHRGVSARATPAALEEAVARRLRQLAIPDEVRRVKSPVAPTADTLAMGRSHWADHCAVCHGNDGRGDTAIGRGLYPRAPDMRLDATQRLTDGELFFIIENGIRFTGMPGWGGGGPDGDVETWHLVQFVRHLPELTAEELLEMEHLNPKTRAELADQEETRAYLEGGGAPDPAVVDPPEATGAAARPPVGDADPD
ncbi:MAG: c-type cytochrome [Deltaproteobacteria bacterium]|nr:c-type cytochrome [Deltaproteobacteria bacterium]